MVTTAADIRQYAIDKGLMDPKGAGGVNPNAVYSHAQSNGITADQIDEAFGYKPGQTAAWVAGQGLKPLSGPGIINTAKVPANPKVTTAADIRQYAIDKGLMDPKGAGGVNPNAVYGHALTHGITAAQIDEAFGYKPGQTLAWTKGQGLEPLYGPNTGGAAPPGPPTTSAAAPIVAPAAAPAAAPAGNTLGTINQIMENAQKAVPGMGAPVTAQAERVNPTLAEVPYNQTSAGLVERLLQENSPYLQRARALGLEAVNGRGLLSSSIAAGAATGAAIDRAGPLATTDAGIYANQRLANQSAQNELANANANRQSASAQFNANTANEQTLARFNAATNLGGQLLGGQQRREEMELGAFLDKDKATLMNEFQRGNMSLQNYFDLKAMGYKHDLTLSEMGAAAQIQFARDLQQHGFNLEAMAKTQGYTKENLAAALGIDLTKMAAGQKHTLDQMAVTQGFNLEALAKTHGYDMEKVAAQVASQIEIAKLSNTLDTESKKDIMKLASSLDATVTGKAALTNALSTYVTTISTIQSDPNMDAEAKNIAKTQAQTSFYGFGKMLGSVHNVDISEFLTAVGLPQNTPAGTTGTTGTTGIINTNTTADTNPFSTNNKP